MRDVRRPIFGVDRLRSFLFLKVIVLVTAVVLGLLLHRYRETYLVQLTAREFGPRRQYWESEADFQRRRGRIWLWVCAVAALIAYVAGRAWLQDPSGDLVVVVFMATALSLFIAAWSLREAIRAFIAARKSPDV